MIKRREFLKSVREGRESSVPSESYWVHVHRRAMACRFEATLPMYERSGICAASEALDEVARLEAQLTIFRDESEVASINRHAAERPIRVETSLFDLLLHCRELSREAEGAFDISSGALSRCWGFVRREGRFPEAEEIEAARSISGFDKITLDPATQTIAFNRTGVEINLGSIGKGYALDRMSRIIRRRASSALLSAGFSSMLAIGGGDRLQTGWEVGVRHPVDHDRRLAVFKLRDAALSTSGSEEQFFEHEGKRYGHIIDPRSGMPAQGVLSATVIAPSAAISDALATAAYVGGPQLAERYCSNHKNILVLLLTGDSDRPILIGENPNCEVEIINE